jgi:hypothetical protein
MIDDRSMSDMIKNCKKFADTSAQFRFLTPKNWHVGFASDADFEEETYNPRLFPSQRVGRLTARGGKESERRNGKRIGKNLKQGEGYLRGAPCSRGFAC